MSRGYVVTLPSVTNAVGGDPSTGTKWNEAWVGGEEDAINDVVSDVDVDMSFLFTQFGADTPDNVSFLYKDSATVAVSAGVAGSLTIASATDVDFSGASISTRYYIWVGEDSVTALTTIKIGTSMSSAPAGMVSGTAHRLRWYVDIDGAGDVEPFWHAFEDDVDDVLYEPDSGDATRLTILAGGKFTAHDGTLYRIEEDITVDIDTDWSADGALAVGFAYLWAGEDSGGDLKIVVSEEAELLPSELVKGRRLRGGIYVWDNGGTKEVLPFHILGNWFYYDETLDVDGSDLTEIYDATVTTSWVTVDASEFVPPGRRFVWAKYRQGGNTPLFIRLKGGTSDGQEYPRANVTDAIHPGLVPINDSGQFEAKNGASFNLRFSLMTYQL